MNTATLPDMKGLLSRDDWDTIRDCLIMAINQLEAGPIDRRGLVNLVSLQREALKLSNKALEVAK